MGDKKNKLSEMGSSAIKLFVVCAICFATTFVTAINCKNPSDQLTGGIANIVACITCFITIWAIIAASFLRRIFNKESNTDKIQYSNPKKVAVYVLAHSFLIAVLIFLVVLIMGLTLSVL